MVHGTIVRHPNRPRIKGYFAFKSIFFRKIEFVPLDAPPPPGSSLIVMSRTLSPALVLTLIFLSAASAASQSFDSLSSPVAIRYSVEFHASMDDASFSAMSRRVSGRPEHPDRRSFEFEKRRREQGPDRVMYDAWADERGIVRFNTSNTSDSLYTDVARDGRKLWMLSPAQLTIAGEAATPPDAPDLRARLEECSATVSYFLTEGRSIRDGLPVGPWEGDDRKMVARGDGLELGWHRDTSGTTTVRVARADLMPEEVGRKWVLRDRFVSEPFGTEIARVFEEFTPSGLLERRISIEDVREVDKAVIKRVTALPPLDGHDEVRGEVTYRTIVDSRSNTPEIIVSTEEGSRSSPKSHTTRSRQQLALRVIGWTTAVMLTAAMLGFRVILKHRGR